MKRIAAAVAGTFERWNVEAMLRAASHGKAGGAFVRQVWANGREMVGGIEGGREWLANHWLPVAVFDAIKAAGWKVVLN